MGRTVVRRQADSLIVQQLWEGITMIRNQRQVANLDRVSRYMKREYGVDFKECKRQLDLSVDDFLMIKEISTGKKGARAGIAQDAFWCVEEIQEESPDSHDWYCFTCHKGGGVICCDSCHRVYHPQCINEDIADHNNDEKWNCPVCKVSSAPHMVMRKSDLYKVFVHVLDRMKEKASQLHKKMKLKSMPNYFNLVYRHVDLGTIIHKVEKKKYKNLEEFEADAQEMVHTSAVYYGLNSDRTTLSQLTLKDCRYDLAEVRLCKDCYLSSNNRRSDKDWFCKPCHPPHELAWVHMRGFGFWPAKVLARKEGRADVRFFGKRHERALVTVEDVRDIDTDPSTLRIKVTKGWRTARLEMQRHREMVEAGGGEMEEEEEEEKEKPKTKHGKGTRRTISEVESEAEEFVRRSNTDAGQVNSISTSGGNSTDMPPTKKKKSSHRKSGEQSRSVFQHSTPNDLENISQDLSMLTDPFRDATDETADKIEITVTLEEPKLPLEESSDDALLEAKSEIASDDEGEGEVPKEPGVCDCKDKYEVMLAEYKAEQEEKMKKRLEERVQEAVEEAQNSWEEAKSSIESTSSTTIDEGVAAAREKLRNELQEQHQKKMEELKEKHREEISSTKKKQWCINCEQEAMYHCCWNTSYCSISCQQMHWHKEHKRLCRRRR